MSLRDKILPIVMQGRRENASAVTTTDAILAALDTDALLRAALELAAETVEECEGVNFGIRAFADDDEAKAAIKAKAGWS